MAVTLTDMVIYRRLVAAGNDALWMENIDVSVGTMIELAASDGDIDTSDNLNMFTAYQKVFVLNGTNLKVADFVNTKLTHTALTTAHAKGDILTQATSNAKMVVDFTNTAKTATWGYVTTGTFDTTNAITGDGDGTGFTPTGINGMLTHTALGTAHAADDVLTQATTNATMTVEYTDAAKTHTWGRITSGTFNTTNSVTGSGSGTAFTPTSTDTSPCTWYDWTVYSGDTAFGAMPDQAYLGCNYCGRAVLSGDPDYPHQWYMSRQANPWDWNYISNDAQSPVAGGNADAGECGDIILALIPYKDDFLIFGCATTLWYMVGDPALGGSILELDLTAGILGAHSHCWDNADNLYMLTSAGLLKIPQGFQVPESLTSILYPDFIKDLAYNPALHRITMGYDSKRHGISIIKTTLADGTNSCWWYEIRTKGLFPESYPEECGAYSIFSYGANDPDYRGLLYGCKDGYIRIADDTAKDDDIGGSDEAIDSYYTQGPIPIGGEINEGKVTSLTGIPVGGGVSGGSVTDSSDVAWKLWTGKSADEVVEKMAANTTPNVSGTMTAPGRRRGSKKSWKIRGMFAGIRVGNDTAAEAWSLERLLLGIDKAGRLK